MKKLEKTYAKRLREYLLINDKDIENAMNTPEGLTLFSNYFRPKYKDRRFDKKIILSTTTTDFKKEGVSDEVAAVSRLKKAFSQYKSDCCKEKRKIKMKDLEFWSNLLNVSLVEMLELQGELDEKEDNLKEDMYFYISEDKIDSLISSFVKTLKDLDKSKYGISPLFFPIAIHMLTGSILVVAIDSNKYLQIKPVIRVKYYMTVYRFNALHDIIRSFPGLRYKLAKMEYLSNNYVEARDEFIFRCKQVLEEHYRIINLSFSDIEKLSSDLYKQTSESCNYLKKALKKNT